MSGLLFSIVAREMKGLARRDGFHARRLLAVSVMGILVVGGQAGGVFADVTGLGYTLFAGVAGVLLFLACFAAPCAVAPGMAREYEQGTIDLVRLSGVRVGELAAGKWIAAMIRMLLLVFAGIPSIILCVGLGGISPAQVFEGLAVVFGALLVSSSLGFAATTACRTSWTAWVVSLAAAVAWFICLPIVVSTSRWIHGLGVSSDTVAAFAAGPAFARVLGGEGTSVLPRYGMFSLLAGVVLVLVGIGLAALGTWWHDHVSGLRAWSAGQRRGAVRGNPLSWRECPRWYGSAGTWEMLAAVVAFLGLVFVWPGRTTLVSDMFEEIPRGSGTEFALVLTIVGSLVLAFRVLLGCASALADERRARTLDLLLLSPLSDRDIVLGTLWGQLTAALPWLWLSLGAWCVVWVSDCEIVPAYGCAVTGYLAGLLASGCYVLMVSLRWGRGAATVAAVLAMVPIAAGALLSAQGAWATLFWVLLSLVLADFHLGKLLYRYRRLQQLDVV